MRQIKTMEARWLQPALTGTLSPRGQPIALRSAAL